MGKLLKYEFRKSWSVKLMALGIFGVLEAIFLLGLLLDNRQMVGNTAVFLTLAAFFVPLAIGIASAVILHRDMNSKQGYMLFMTPRNCYQILGAKVIENGVSVLASGAVIALLGVLDLSLLFSHFNMLDEFWSQISQILNSLYGLHIDRQVILVVFLNLLCSWLGTVSIVFFADILACSLLRGKRFSGLAAFVLFVVLSIVLRRLTMLVTEPLQRQTLTYLLTDSAISLVCAIGLYFASAAVMNRNLNV